MTDSSSSDKNQKNSNADDLSLAELLGTGGDEAAAEPRRATEGRSDEPSSGMIRLSAMIASASVEQAKTPSIVPPTPARPDVTPTGSVHYTAPPPEPAPALPPAKSGGMMWMILVVVIAAVAVGAFAFLRPSPEPANTAELERQIAELKSQRSSALSEAEAQALKAKLAELEAAKTTAQKAEEPKVAAAEPVKEEPKAASDRTPRTASAVRPPREAREDKPATTAAKPAAKEEAPKAETKTEPTAAAKPSAEELDSLLGGKKKEEAKAEPKKEEAASGLPKQPDRAAVQSAMNSVTSKAQACSKYSTGTIQLKVTVGNDGKVKSAESLGAFAGTTAGKCVEMLARTAKFPKFSDPTFSVTYPITLK